MYPTNDIMMYGTETGAVTSMLETMWSALAGMFVVILMLAVIMIIAYWKLFKKAGQPGWAAIVPFYSQVVLSKVAGINIWFYLGILIAAVVGWFIPIISTLAMIAQWIWSIYIVCAIPGKFGKGAGFGFGLFFLPFIFYPILAFGKSEYQG